MTNKQILTAQKILRKLDGIPIKVTNDGRSIIQVTYDLDTYNMLLGTLSDVAAMPMAEPLDSSGYHRDRV